MASVRDFRATTWIRRVLAAALAAWPAAAVAAGEAPRFDLPVQCDLRTACWVEQYVDADPRPGAARDWAGGGLTYDGHEGTDIRVVDLAAMRRGVPVIAAADGVVIAVRDGMPDRDVREPGAAAAIAEAEAGNVVVIDHGAGWRTIYGHLRQGSVAVRTGDRVRRGARLGLIGMSGAAAFPHVEFAVTHAGRPVDPFAPGAAARGPIQLVAAAGTRDAERRMLWTEAAAGAFGYSRPHVLDAGFAPERPTRRAVEAGAYRDATWTAGDRLVYWVDATQLQPGDVEQLSLVAPDGRTVIARQRTVAALERHTLRFDSVPLDGLADPRGVWHGRYQVLRNGAVVATAERPITLR